MFFKEKQIKPELQQVCQIGRFAKFRKSTRKSFVFDAQKRLVVLSASETQLKIDHYSGFKYGMIIVPSGTPAQPDLFKNRS